jgi:Skp family chaperone for outer membrane proteins
MRKNIVILVVFSLVAVFASSLLAEESSSNQIKFGWVDLKMVMKNYYKTEEVLSQFEKEKAVKEAEVKKLVDEIENMEAGLSRLSDTARREKEEEILKKKISVNAMIQEAEQELGNKSMAKQGKLLEEIIAQAEILARKEGYTFIFRGDMLIYKDPALECTNRIITELNKGRESVDGE